MTNLSKTEPISEGRVRPLVQAISALGSQLKGLARARPLPSDEPTSDIVTSEGAATMTAQPKGWPGKTACLLPWRTMIKPSTRERLLIDAHRDDWP